MANATPVFPDLGYAISRSNVVSVGFQGHQQQQFQQYQQQAYPQYHQQQYATSQGSHSPNSSPTSQNSQIYAPASNMNQYQPTISPTQYIINQQPAQSPRPEFKRRKTVPNVVQGPVKVSGNRRIPRVIAAAAPKKGAGDAVVQGVTSANWMDASVKKEKEATVFGYVFDGDS